MCKLLIVTNISKLTDKQLSTLIDKAAKPISKYERDGFGFAYTTEDGVYAERWVDPDEFAARKLKAGPYDHVLAQPAEFDSVGNAESKHVGGLLVHGRTSTNDVALMNTHPFINDKHVLIHNGVVQNVGEHVERVSTNDTEFILTHYTNGGMARVAESVSGYYACGMLDIATGNTIVFRDSTASLFVAWIAKFETYMFATTKEILIAAAAAIGVKRVSIRDAQLNFHVVFDKTGKLIDSSTFEPLKRSFGSLDDKSLGRSAAGDAMTAQSPHWFQDVPSWRYDERDERDAYEYISREGLRLDADQYEVLTADEQDACEVRYGGRKLA